MNAKRINLTLNEKFFEALQKKAEERAMNPTEYIYETLRQRVFSLPIKKTGAGRPKKVDDQFLTYFTRDR